MKIAGFMDKGGFRFIRDSVTTKLMGVITLSIVIIFFVILFFLIWRSSLLLGEYSITEILLSSRWSPKRGEFGLYPIMIGTILVTGIALLIAVPISILSAVYISEYAPLRLRHIVRPFIDLLSGVPSVVYGLCAFLFLVPIVKDYIAPLFGVQSTGLCIFTASVTLAVMVLPIIISLCVEAFTAVPLPLREASLSVGATRWETVKKVIFRASAPSIISAILLGFGRAFGETIAVNMVVGGISRVPSSLFDPSQTFASKIISDYSELSSIPIRESALLFMALLLLIVVVVFNILSKILLYKTQKRWSY
ncbi:MAG: phosphate ABC transporter permease subunit PstC [Candidatus Thermoplasmatota archaeon]